MAYEATLLYHPLTKDQLELLKSNPRKYANKFEMMGSDIYLTGTMDGRWKFSTAYAKTLADLELAENRYKRPMAAIIWKVSKDASFFSARQFVTYVGKLADENLFGPGIFY